MIVIRRELPPSRIVGQHKRPPVRHREIARVLRAAASPPGPERSLTLFSLHRGRRRKVLRDRPNKPGQLSRDRDCGHLSQFIATGESPELAVQSVLCLACDVEDRRRTAAAALRQLLTGGIPMAVVPGGLDQDPAEVRVASLSGLGRKFGDVFHEALYAAGLRIS